MAVPALVYRDITKEARDRLRKALEEGRLTPDAYLKELKKVKPGEGYWHENPEIRYSKPAWFIPNNKVLSPADPALITLGVGATTGELPIELDEGGGHGEAFYLLSKHSGPYEFEILDQGRTYKWMSGPIHADTITGNALRPFILPISAFFNTKGGTRNVMFKAWNLDAALPITIRFSMHGRRFLFHEAEKDQDVPRSFFEFFAKDDRGLPIFLKPQDPILALGAGASTSPDGEFVAPSDGPIVISKLTAWTNPVATPFKIEIKEFASGRSMSAAEMPISGDHAFGDGQYPGILAQPYYLSKNFRIKFKLTNIGAVPADFYPVLSGTKILV